MYYYFYKDLKVLKFKKSVDTKKFKEFAELSKQQKEFYLSNPYSTIQEIKSLTLNSASLAPTLDSRTEEVLNELSNYSLKISNKIVPQYKIQNALLGMYSEEGNLSILNRATEVGSYCRSKFYYYKDLILKCKTIEEVDDLLLEAYSEYNNFLNSEL